MSHFPSAKDYSEEPMRFPPLSVIDVVGEASAVGGEYRNQVLSRVNTSCLRLAVMSGEYPWHPIQTLGLAAYGAFRIHAACQWRLGLESPVCEWNLLPAGLPFPSSGDVHTHTGGLDVESRLASGV